MNLNGKIIYGLERLSDAFKALLWEKAKVYGISPIQIQILLFVADHIPKFCNVSYLAKEFNVTKPTVSDAVRVLNNKGYLEKQHSAEDSRSYVLSITNSGKDMIEKVAEYTLPIEKALQTSDDHQREDLYASITELIHKLNKQGIIQVQRICFSCRFYDNQGQRHYCNLLHKPLKETEIRLDCPEYEEK